MSSAQVPIARFEVRQTFALSNSLINRPLNLSLTESRIFFSLVSQIQKGDEDFKVYKIFIKDLIDVIKPKSKKNMYAQVKRDMLTLEEKKFIFSDGNKTAPIRLLVAPVYHANEGYITSSIHPLLKPDLLQLKEEFTVGLICEMLRFKSYHTQRIYLLVRQYRNAKVKVHRMTVEHLKKVLGVEDKYNRFSDLKRRVLLPAQKEIAQIGLIFDIKEHKHGRSVEEISFAIIQDTDTAQNFDVDFSDKKNKEIDAEDIEATPTGDQMQLDFLPQTEEDKDKMVRLHQRLLDFRLSDIQIEKIFNQIDKAWTMKEVWTIVRDVQTAQHDGRIKGTVGGYAAYLFDQKFNLGLTKKK